MSFCTNIVCLLSIMLEPYMPQTSKTIKEQLNVSIIRNSKILGIYMHTGERRMLCVGRQIHIFSISRTRDRGGERITFALSPL